jgi:hypothetical protein
MIDDDAVSYPYHTSHITACAAHHHRLRGVCTEITGSTEINSSDLCCAHKMQYVVNIVMARYPPFRGNPRRFRASSGATTSQIAISMRRFLRMQLSPEAPSVH